VPEPMITTQIIDMHLAGTAIRGPNSTADTNGTSDSIDKQPPPSNKSFETIPTTPTAELRKDEGLYGMLQDTKVANGDVRETGLNPVTEIRELSSNDPSG
jgi:hypothetical protein